MRTWEQSHARGEVPSVWPYGLDALRDHADVELIDLAPPGRIARARARFAVGPRPVDGLALTWDENTAYRMQTTHPRTRFATGVIWLTDMVETGDAPTRMVAMLGRAEAAWVLSEAQVEPVRRMLGPWRDSGVFAVSLRNRQRVLRSEAVSGPSAHRERGQRQGSLIPPRCSRRSLASSRSVPRPKRWCADAVGPRPPEGVQVVRHLPHAELRDLYTTASVVVIPTRPNLHASGMTVALEALATARPVVVTDTPGMHQYVSEGRTGHLVPPEDPAELALAVAPPAR